MGQVFPLLFVDECESTNDFARNFYSVNEEGRFSGIIEYVKPPYIIATFIQRRGRGQFNRKWESKPAQNITATIVIEPQIKVSEIELVNDFAKMAVVRFINTIDKGLLPEIVPPNDIYIKDRKICGILIENIVEGDFLKCSFIGVGININQESFEVDIATSIFKETGRWIPLTMAYLKFREIISEMYYAFFQKKD